MKAANLPVPAACSSRRSCAISASVWRLQGTTSPTRLGPNPYPNVDEELRRWLATEPGADGAAGFHAGWTRLTRVIAPRLQDWEARLVRAGRDNAGLRSHIAALVAEIRRLEDR
jgi:hypothetical protein